MYFEPENEFEEKLGAYFKEKVYSITLSRSEIVDLYIGYFMRDGAYILEINKPTGTIYGNQTLSYKYIPIKETARGNKGDNYHNDEHTDRIHIELLFDMDIVFSNSNGWHIESLSNLTDEDKETYFSKALLDSFVIFYHYQFTESLIKNTYKINWVA